jgi:hypothetical protein
MNNPNNNIIINNEINFNFQNNSLKEKLIEKNVNNKDIIEVNSDESNDCLSEYILKPIMSLCCFCCKKSDDDNQEEKRIFDLLPNKVKDISIFKQSLKNKLGIIIIYNQRNILFLKSFINKMIENDVVLNSLKSKCIILPILGSSNEGLELQNIISNNQLIYPVFAFCFNPLKSPNILIQRKNIVYKLEGESTTLDMFLSTLLDSLEKLNNPNANNINNNNNIEDDFNSLSDAEVLEQQKLDMEALERKVENKEEELKKQKLLEEQRKKEEEKKKEEEENYLKELQKKVVEEPSEDDPNATTISFRYPNGETRKDRRFLKSHTIQNIYDFVNSLGKEIYTEEENNKFSLYQPFPPKKYEEMENTLEKEGLFPNAIIQIREE